jgi:hypothetical protein
MTDILLHPSGVDKWRPSYTSPLFPNIQKSYLKNQKNVNFFLEVTKDVYYKSIKSQYEKLYYTKMTKSNKLYSVEMCTVHYKLSYFVA